MELKHEFTVPATLAETWRALNDIESVAACFPGAQVNSVEGDTFQGSCKVKLGPIALVYNGTGTFVEKDEAAGRMVIDAKGKDKRGNGTAGAHVTATMSDAGDGSTRVEVQTDLAITGKPAQFGRGVMQDVSDKLLGQFTDCLEKNVGDGAAPAAPAAATAAASSGSDTPTAQTPTGAEPSDTQAGVASGISAPAPASTAPRTVPGPSSSSGSSSGSASNDDALDLGATVLPVLVKGYWREGLIAVLGLLLLVRVLRRS